MSGVSISQGNNVDLDAIVAGGDEFMARIKTLQQAKADSQAALDALKIGSDVAAAMRDVQAHEQQALKLVEQAKTDAETIIKAATIQAETIRNQAQVDANALLADTAGKSAAIEQEVKVAREMLNAWSDKTKAEASDLMARATITKAHADDLAAANTKAAEDLTKAQTVAKAAIAATNAKQADLDAKLNAIKVAASG